jgi:hypothetical protein
MMEVDENLLCSFKIIKGEKKAGGLSAKSKKVE